MNAIQQAYDAVQRSWTGQQWDAWAATCARDYAFDTGTGLRLDLAGTLDWSRAWFTAFPDYAEDIRALHPAPNSAVAELVGRATAVNDFVVAGVTVLPATGRRFEIAYAKVLVFDADAKVVRDRQYLDTAALLRQFGPN
ncbi:ester cyclase [Nocardia cerradoensis]|uniref:ester cyclase n=1 Tax=Nocardia cerradoensis TaxID=85688 RepID=UPI0002D7E48B|nr:ester cyclase [Nocardia cerradoensis]NKY44399.1 ester cyclase [Nocardia cerradoensis]